MVLGSIMVFRVMIARNVKLVKYVKTCCRRTES